MVQTTVMLQPISTLESPLIVLELLVTMTVKLKTVKFLELIRSGDQMLPWFLLTPVHWNWFLLWECGFFTFICSL